MSQPPRWRADVRFYAIRLSEAPAEAFPPTPGAFIPGAQFCSVINGRNDPSALRVSMQVELMAMDRLVSNAMIRIYGIDKSMIDQAANLTDSRIEVYGGFWPGLELATWEWQFSGLLFQGTVNSAIGNWKGSDMTLDILLNPGAVKASSGDGGGGGGGGGNGTEATSASSRLQARQRAIGRPRNRRSPPPVAAQFDDEGGGGGGLGGALGDALAGFAGGGVGGDPLKLIHNMMEGVPLDSAVKQTLESAFPNSPIMTAMKDGMKLDYHDAGFYQTITQHLGYIKSLSKDLAKATSYGGVNAYPIKNKIVLADGTKPLSEVALNVIDLIGNPTWGGKDADSGKMLVNFMTPMRADIFPAMVVHLPDTFQNLTPGMNVYRAGYPRNLRERTTFNGPVNLTHVMIVGDSRNPQGEAWALSCTGIPGYWGIDNGAAGQPASEAAPVDTTPVRLMARSKRAGVGR